MVKLCKSTYFHASVCLCVHCPSICLSRYFLLNNWAEFNQTCYITFPHGKGVREQHYFSVRPSNVHLSVALSPPKPLGGIQPNLLHHFPSHGKGMREQHYFSVRPSIWPSCYLLNHRAEFNQTCYITSPHRYGVREQHYFLVRLSVRLSF